MNLLRNTNSWHWLLMAVAACLLVVAYPCHLVWKKASADQAPKLQAMTSHTQELELLREDDVSLLEYQAAEIQKRTAAYEAAVRSQKIQPIPAGEQSVLSLSNEISRALLKHQLRVIEQEQQPGQDQEEKSAVQALPADAPPEAKRAAAAARATMASQDKQQDKQSLPFKTREIRYVVEGNYQQMFMFLVRQSHQKPSYHFKDIQIMPSSPASRMRMEFTVQIHFT